MENAQVDSGKPSFAPADAIKYSVQGFLGNALSSMPSYTYYIRLSICHPMIVRNLSKIPSEKKIIIAETGTTSVFSISDLELFQAVSYENETRGAMGQGFNITIIETHGSALLDYINRACIDLQINTPKEATYILEIMFNNSNAEGVTPGQSEYYFVYPLKFTSMNIQVTERGGQYRIRATEPGIDAIYGNVGPTINNACTIPAKNLGEFVNEFVEFLNQCALDEVEACHHSVRDKYGIDIPDDWKSYKFGNLEGKESANSQSSRAFNDPSKLLIQIPKGSYVPDILTSVFGSVVEFQKIKTASGRGFMKTSPDADLEKADEIASYFRLVADMWFGDYDDLRKRYSRTYLWGFKEYKEPAIYDANLLKEFNNAGVMRKRVTNLINEQLLAKRYDYNYTGLNTEVIRFDMSFDLTYFRSLPIRAGHQAEVNYIQNVKKADVAVHDTYERRDKKAKPKQAANEAAATRQQSRGTPNKKHKARPTKVTKIIGEQAALAAQTKTNIRKGSGYYLESYALPDVEEEITFHQISSTTQDIPTDIKGIVSPDNSTGMIKFGNSYLELTGGAELASIDLEIKGDPYWLGMSNLTKQFRNANTGIADFAMYEKGAPMFWLNVNSPTEPNPNTGKMEFVDNTTISGIFKVKTVISRFQAGGFVQTLVANRDFTNYEKARSTLLKFTNEEQLKREKAARETAAMVGEFEGATVTDPNAIYTGGT
tara:strand:+ start:1035 stop:3173 length:2139 start_codon:yes stop_codon:yes gene_type:complete